MNTSEECSSQASMRCLDIGKQLSHSALLSSLNCCIWDCEIVIPEHSYVSTDNDVALGFPNYLKTKSTCVDDFGTHEDYCASEGWVVDWYTISDLVTGEKYCSNSTSILCSSEFGAASTCVNGACT